MDRIHWLSATWLSATWLSATAPGLILALFAVSGANAQNPDSQIDKIFQNFDAKSPGCSVGVVQNGKSIFSKAYGMADLEHDVPLTTASPFYMASVSKQFTAMSVLLLAEDGKIKLTDSIRKTIPELPDYANAITLYQLLTHTSGVRDYLSLGSMAGLSPDYVFTDRGALRLISRQTALNFEPGTEFLYSNSGYVLLSIMVKRVSDKNLDQFAREKLFDPLGMKSTRFQHDHSALVPGKAFGYQRRDGVWHVSNSMLDVVGDGGLYSTVSDMMHWLANFDDPKVGAKALETMRTAAKLTSGKNIDYGMGLVPARYRGLEMVQHNGGLGGYRTQVLWFPAERFSVVALCNNGSANAGDLANKTAEVYLSSKMTAPPTPVTQNHNPAGVTLTAEEVHAKVGLYRSADGGYVEIEEREGKLYPRGAPAELIALDKSQLRPRNAPEGFELIFDTGNPAPSVRLNQGGAAAVRFDRVSPVKLSESEMKAYAGDFESPELLDATYRILADAQGLSLEAGERPLVRLQNSGADRWRAPGQELVFHRDAAGKVDAFTMNAGRVRKIQFRRP
jgi:CubicO group peptidase (beta-lactamase class C family)